MWWSWNFFSLLFVDETLKFRIAVQAIQIRISGDPLSAPLAGSSLMDADLSPHLDALLSR
jgi:hypothetical protein